MAGSIGGDCIQSKSNSTSMITTYRPKAGYLRLYPWTRTQGQDHPRAEQVHSRASAKPRLHVTLLPDSASPLRLPAFTSGYQPLPIIHYQTVTSVVVQRIYGFSEARTPHRIARYNQRAARRDNTFSFFAISLKPHTYLLDSRPLTNGLGKTTLLHCTARLSGCL